MSEVPLCMAAVKVLTPVSFFANRGASDHAEQICTRCVVRAKLRARSPEDYFLLETQPSCIPSHLSSGDTTPCRTTRVTLHSHVFRQISYELRERPLLAHYFGSHPRTLSGGDFPFCVEIMQCCVHADLAHKKTPPPRTLQ